MSGAWASDKNGDYSVQGATSCGSYIEDRKNNEWAAVADLTWIAGYISAYNRMTPDTYDILGGTDLKGVSLWMENWCKANPLSNVSGGMAALTRELWPRRYRTAKDAGK